MQSKFTKIPRRLYTRPYSINFSQNFLKSSDFVDKLIDLCNLDKNDTVIEIGAGKGILTEKILQKSKEVIAIEKDKSLASGIKSRLSLYRNLLVVEADFMEWKLPQTLNYKIVGNIPFALSANITRKLLDAFLPPKESFLIVQKEFAERLMGLERGETLFSLSYKPWFTTKILRKIPKSEFAPAPSVNAVFIQISQNKNPSVSLELKKEYIKFINYCFNYKNPKKSKVFLKIFTKKQISIIKERAGIDLDMHLHKLVFSEWIYLFNTFMVYGDRKLVN